MGDVIKFDRRTEPPKVGPWFNVLAVCFGCLNRWIGTVEAKVALHRLECPTCGAFDSFASILPHDYLEAFQEDPDQ